MGDITLTFSGGRTGLTEEVVGQRLQAAAPLLAESRIGAMSFCEPRSWTKGLSSLDRLAS